MNHTARLALRLALRLAEPDTADALAERLRPELLAVLADRFGLPEGMVEELLGADAAQMRAALSIDPEEWLLGAAEMGDPVVGLALWHAVFRDEEDDRRGAVIKIPGLLATLLHSADLADPRWYDDEGLCTILCQEPVGRRLVPLLTSGFPGLNIGGLAVFGVHLPPPVVVDACLGHLEMWGSTEPLTGLLDLLEDVPTLDPGHPWLPDLLRQAIDAPDPEAFLREHRPAGEWADPEHLRALLELRYGVAPPAKPDGLDWDLIRREHERLPLGTAPGYSGNYGAGLLRLTQWEGCPADLVMESFRHDPYETARHAVELPFEALMEADTCDLPLNHILARGFREGWLSPHRVFTEVTPAADVLRALPYDHEPTRKAVAELVAPLGADPVNWLTFYDRMRRYPGTSIAGLIADVVEPGSRKKRCTSWYRPRTAQFPAGPSEDSRAAFLGMFGCASQEAQLAVVPHFDALAVQQFLGEGNPTPAVRDAVVAAHGLPALMAMAAGYPRGDKLEYLLDLDEPAVDVQLWRHALLDRSERARLLAGRLRGGGTRPVPEELLAELDDLVVSEDRDLLLAGLESGDLGVARRVLGRLRLYLPATRLRLLIAVWERGGPEAVREILAMDRLPVTLRRRTEKLLEAPDGLERMRDRLAEEAAPDRLAAYLIKPGDGPEKRLHRLLGEGLEPPWSALVAAHRAGPLPADLVDVLVESHPEDCPRELLLAGLGNAPERWGSWTAEALRTGSLTLVDLFHHTGPAEAALDLLHRYRYGHPDDRFPEETWLPVLERAAALAREHLGTDVEAWAVSLRLLPTFVGTLPELAATSGAMTRVPG